MSSIDPTMSFDEMFGGHNETLRRLNRAVSGAQYVDVYPSTSGSHLVSWFTRRHATTEIDLDVTPAEIVRAAVATATVRFKGAR